MTTADDDRRAEDQRWEEGERIARRDGCLPIGPAPVEVQEAVVCMLRKARAEEAVRHRAREEAVERQDRETARWIREQQDRDAGTTRTRGRR